jgi:hypothetical protein
MFQADKINSFEFSLNSLTIGDGMFLMCSNLTTFTSELGALTSAMSMFEGCNKLTTFTSDLSSLTNGEYMFAGCKLDKESVINIITCLKEKNNCTTAASLTLGIDNNLKNDVELQTLLNITSGATSTTLMGNGGKLWTIMLEWN